MTADPDLAALQVIEPGEQGDQGRFARAVGSQQRGETPRGQAEADLVQRLPGAVGEAQVADVQGVHGVTTTPQGYRPTFTDLMTLRLSTSITETSPLTPLVASNCF